MLPPHARPRIPDEHQCSRDAAAGSVEHRGDSIYEDLEFDGSYFIDGEEEEIVTVHQFAQRIIADYMPPVTSV